MLLKALHHVRAGLLERRFSTLYRVDAIEGGMSADTTCVGGRGFSTLYRVDAIEGSTALRPACWSVCVSVPSIGSMLLKASTAPHQADAIRCFSTLYRVDAIEGRPWPQL